MQRAPSTLRASGLAVALGRRSHFPLLALTVSLAGGALVGLIASRQPLLAIVLGIVALLTAVTLRNPVWPVVLMMPLLALSPEYYTSFRGQASAITRLYSVLVVSILLVLLIARGPRARGIPEPIVVNGLIIVFGLTLASQLEPGLTKTKLAVAFISLAVPWLAVLVRVERREVPRLLFAISLVAVMCVVFGFVLQAAGQTTIFFEEFTGVNRLQGATIPAFLGMMGTAGVAASAALGRIGYVRSGAWLGLVNVLIVALTGTRGAVVASLIIAAPLAYRFFFQRAISLPVTALRLLAGLVLLAVLAALYVPELVARTNSTRVQSGVESSGRFEAWSYFFDETAASPTFGLGMGSVPLIGERKPSTVPGDFRAAHNEYVRMYVEGGRVGLLLSLVAIVIFLARTFRATSGRYRPEMGALFVAWAVYAFVDNLSSAKFALPVGLVIGIYTSLSEPGGGAGVRAGAAGRPVLVGAA